MKLTYDKLTRLQGYCDLIKKLADDYHDRSTQAMVRDKVNKDTSIFDNFRYNVDYSLGKKYAKVFTMYQDGSSKSLHSFVDMENGDIVKGSWKAPIRDKSGKLAVRGNIWADDLGESNITMYGPKYLR